MLHPVRRCACQRHKALLVNRFDVVRCSTSCVHSHEALQSDTFGAFEIKPLNQHSGFGARLSGLDLRDSSFPKALSQQMVEVAQAHGGLVCVEAGSINKADLVRFSRLFGELQRSPASSIAKYGDGEGWESFVWSISNVKENGAPIGALGSSELEWHSDMSYVEQPPTYSILHAHEVPDDGRPATCFLSMTHALHALPATLRQQLEGKNVVHDATYSSDGILRQGFMPVTDVSNNQQSVAHPAIRTVPGTGELALFPGRRTNSYVAGLSVAQSEALLDALWSAITPSTDSSGEQYPGYYEHLWRRGQIMIWDNRRLIHRRDAFDQILRRIMWRTQVQGEPVHPAMQDACAS